MLRCTVQVRNEEKSNGYHKNKIKKGIEVESRDYAFYPMYRITSRSVCPHSLRMCDIAITYENLMM